MSNRPSDLFYIKVQDRPAHWWGRRHRWWWNLIRKANGEIFATSEMYTRKANRDHSVNLLADTFGLEIKT